MKSFVFLLLVSFTSLCASQSIDVIGFKIDENPNLTFNTGSVINYSFSIKGDYRYMTHGYNQIDLILYEDQVSQSNEINRIYWNREGDSQLNFENYTKQNMWVSINANSTSTTPGKVFILEVGYAGLTEFYSYAIPDPDSDNDGLTDSVDDCPFQAGPISNNGCPLNELAHLEITKLRILRNGSQEIFNSNTNSTPVLSYGNSYEFIYTIENSGGQATNLDLSKFLSYNATFDPYQDFFLSQVQSTSISAGGELTLSTYLNPGYGNIGTASVSNNQGYYIIFSLVYENSDQSISEYENRIGFIYSTNISEKSISSPYFVQSFDFNGNLLDTEKVKNKEEESDFIQSLPAGDYIIKSGNGNTYKISKGL